MDSLEIEVKFPVTDPEEMRKTLIRRGARLIKGRVFEVNHRYDDPNQGLRKNSMILRLRKDTTATLTVKSKPSGETNNEFKIHTELEVEVSDFEKMERIIEALGFERQQTYEKWRETYAMDETEIVLDTLPYGEFIEIEGDKDKIRGVCGLLGLEWEKRVLSSYLELFERIKRTKGLTFTDITFDNFKGI
jgi:adenylate cyclase class 2